MATYVREKGLDFTFIAQRRATLMRIPGCDTGRKPCRFSRIRTKTPSWITDNSAICELTGYDYEKIIKDKSNRHSQLPIALSRITHSYNKKLNYLASFPAIFLISHTLNTRKPIRIKIMLSLFDEKQLFDPVTKMETRFDIPDAELVNVTSTTALFNFRLTLSIRR